MVLARVAEYFSSSASSHANSQVLQNERDDSTIITASEAAAAARESITTQEHRTEANIMSQGTDGIDLGLDDVEDFDADAARPPYLHVGPSRFDYDGRVEGAKIKY